MTKVGYTRPSETVTFIYAKIADLRREFDTLRYIKREHEIKHFASTIRRV